MYISLIGIQGSGKGTQAKHIVDTFGFTLFEMGAELRKFAASSHPRAAEVHATLHAGSLVSLDVIREVITDYMSGQSGDARILFDGVPRSMEQREIFDALVPDYAVVFLDLDRARAVERLSGRRICPITYEVFPADFPLDHNPKNGAKLITRHDDTPAAIDKRIGAFFDSTFPLVTYWREQGREIYRIDADQSVDTVFDEISTIIRKKL